MHDDSELFEQEQENHEGGRGTSCACSAAVARGLAGSPPSTHHKVDEMLEARVELRKEAVAAREQQRRKKGQRLGGKRQQSHGNSRSATQQILAICSTHVSIGTDAADLLAVTAQAEKRNTKTSGQARSGERGPVRMESTAARVSTRAAPEQEAPWEACGGPPWSRNYRDGMTHAAGGCGADRQLTTSRGARRGCWNGAQTAQHRTKAQGQRSDRPDLKQYAQTTKLRSLLLRSSPRTLRPHSRASFVASPLLPPVALTGRVSCRSA